MPQLGAPTPDEIQLGRRLFVDKGCASCHAIEGVTPQRDFGPDLSALGGKDVSQLSFGGSKIPRNLIAYIQAKITNPLSVNPAARMPLYRLAPADLDAVTTALLSMTGTPSTQRSAEADRAARRGGVPPDRGIQPGCTSVISAMCATHFNGFGGTLAPDLSYEGSRSQRQWLISFLKNPQTLRPTLVFRMPQFNMTDQEATILADYIGLVLAESRG